MQWIESRTDEAARAQWRWLLLRPLALVPVFMLFNAGFIDEVFDDARVDLAAGTSTWSGTGEAVLVVASLFALAYGVVVGPFRNARRVRAVAADDIAGWQPAVVYEYTNYRDEEPSLTDRLRGAELVLECPGEPLLDMLLVPGQSGAGSRRARPVHVRFDAESRYAGGPDRDGSQVWPQGRVGGWNAGDASVTVR
jgi:hypothetical protein